MIYLVFHNQTDAMRCRNVLQMHDLQSKITKPPRREPGASCAWAVRIPAELRDHAGQVCLNHDIRPCAWYDERGGTIG